MKHRFKLVGLAVVVVVAAVLSATDGLAQLKQKELSATPSAGTLQTSPRPAGAQLQLKHGDMISDPDIVSKLIEAVQAVREINTEEPISIIIPIGPSIPRGGTMGCCGYCQNSKLWCCVHSKDC